MMRERRPEESTRSHVLLVSARHLHEACSVCLHELGLGSILGQQGEGEPQVLEGNYGGFF
jgi:hypothetical protein